MTINPVFDMTYANHIDSIQKIISKEYDDKMSVSLNDIISSYTVGFDFQDKKDITENILLIYNIDYRKHSMYLSDTSFVLKKTIEEHLTSFNIDLVEKEEQWKDFLDAVEMESMIYKKGNR
ncbi:hypothetical protein [Flammeovirga aprica]|uniref:Uncharacterized protein n=1 Tax=Flammeovirga aprica JL-4 TaxID=694437 RepID=A0A7X9XC49_9BACT|nr:hypothetical protein [Flammeovirga aprica]NME71427.1 hypothetical protein [Flammeovirga aprica JL-4]